VESRVGSSRGAESLGKDEWITGGVALLGAYFALECGGGFRLEFVATECGSA
jgi:hypothetical protein